MFTLDQTRHLDRAQRLHRIGELLATALVRRAMAEEAFKIGKAPPSAKHKTPTGFEALCESKKAELVPSKS